MNQDGHQDVVFTGKIVFIQGQTASGDWYDGEGINGGSLDYSVNNPFKKIPVIVAFLYNEGNKRFQAEEDYVEKYELYK